VGWVLAADAVFVTHLAFLALVVLGGFLALRWPRLLGWHAAAVAYAIGNVVVGWPCPLTGLEQEMLRRAGQEGYTGSFVTHYLEGVVYPEGAVLQARAVVAALVATSTALLVRRWRRQRGARATPADAGARAEARGGDTR
jgi:hypothetical protein